MLIELIPLYMFVAVCLVLLLGYPVAFSLAGTALIFAGIGISIGHFDSDFLSALPNRLYGTITNTTLMAVPLFVMMGVMLEKSKVAEELLGNMAVAFGQLRGGLAISVVAVGMLLAASTGIVGATVVTMGLISLPTMLKHNYDPKLATGVICATGTLGQIIPPSIALVLLGDILSNAYQQAQLNLGIFNPKTVSVGDLFFGAVVPGLLLVTLYIVYLLTFGYLKPGAVPQAKLEDNTNTLKIIKGLFPPIILIVTVLGSILAGAATPTEAASIGALGATLLALMKRELNINKLREVSKATLEVTSMVFMILIGATIFSLIFRGFGGDELVHHFFNQMPGGVLTATAIVMLIIFLLGFILDFIEITFLVVPIVGPILLTMGIDPIWLGIMIAINLQTSFLTPPFGFALFYLRGVAPASVKTVDIYRGVIPFVIIQLLVLAVIATWPNFVTWLPEYLQ